LEKQEKWGKKNRKWDKWQNTLFPLDKLIITWKKKWRRGSLFSMF
jgi:hypothetical protein